MKKFLVVAVGIALCFGFAASASAFEGGALESQTTFTLYDKDDPFDLTIDPGLLYEIDRWRLYTNLSNYEDADAYYLIGTSGKIGPGSLAIIYETTKDYLDESDLAADDWTGIELPNVAPTVGYTGTDDIVQTFDDSRSFKDETEEEGLYLAYSVDLGIASLGAGLDYKITDERNVSLDRAGGFSGVIGGNTMGGAAVDYNTVAGLWTMPLHNETLNQGNAGGYGAINTTGNYSRRQVTTLYGDTGHTKSYNLDTRDSFTGVNDIEDDSLGFTVSSLIRPSDEFEIQATLGFEDVDVAASGSGVYSYTRTESQTGTTAIGDIQPLPFLDGYSDTQTEASRWNGNLMHNLILIDDAYSHDGTGWGLELRPSYELNEVTRLELRLGYETADGDADGGWTQNVTIDRSLTNTITTNPQTWGGTQTFNNTWSGDWEEDHFSIEPRIYLTYGPVDFSLGIGYSSEEKELDGRTREDLTASWAYQDGDGVATAADWTFAGSYTSYSDWKLEDDVTAWSFPVATMFNVTDKLTFRAGARFTRETHDLKYSNRFVGTENELWTITDGTGIVIAAGEDGSYIDAAGDLQPYDPTSETENVGESQETDIDITEYRLGLGYQVTEHLAFDLMFASENGSAGGVNTKVVYASAVLAF